MISTMGAVRAGFAKLKAQSFSILVLFLYQLVWGWLFYRFIRSVVDPLLHRYPGGGSSKEAVELFLAEGQFRLLKSDLAEPYLWTLAAFAAVRLLLTPVLNAGLYYSFHRTDLNPGYRFVTGVKRFTMPFLFLHLFRTAVILAPVLWAGPKLWALLHQDMSLTDILWTAAPYAAIWFVGALLIHLLLMHIQFAIVSEAGWWRGLNAFGRGLPPVLGSFLLIGATSAAAMTAMNAASLIWAGIAALIAHQVQYLASICFRLWGLAAQHEIWSDRQ
jgi:hypothetical protein